MFVNKAKQYFEKQIYNLVLNLFIEEFMGKNL